MITRNVNINLDPRRPPLHPIMLSQGDKAVSLLAFHVYYGDDPFELPSGGSASIAGLKPDGKAFAYDAAEISGNTIIFDVTDQITAVPGIVRCELRIVDRDDSIGTPNFGIMIERSPVGDCADLSESDLSLMEQAVEASERTIKAADDVAHAITEAEYTLLSIENGRLLMYRSDASPGKLNFAIRDHKNLEVEYL